EPDRRRAHPLRRRLGAGAGLQHPAGAGATVRGGVAGAAGGDPVAGGGRGRGRARADGAEGPMKAVGIDLGGTNLRAALVDTGGGEPRLLLERKLALPATDPDTVCATAARAV